MPNITLTPQMEEFAEREVAAGAYQDVSEVVRDAVRRLMEERSGVAFYALKADLERQVTLAEAGETEEFDLRTFEPDAFR